jgi:hypothetical protein
VPSERSSAPFDVGQVEEPNLRAVAYLGRPWRVATLVGGLVPVAVVVPLGAPLVVGDVGATVRIASCTRTPPGAGLLGGFGLSQDRPTPFEYKRSGVGHLNGGEGKGAIYSPSSTHSQPLLLLHLVAPAGVFIVEQSSGTSWHEHEYTPVVLSTLQSA